MVSLICVVVTSRARAATVFCGDVGAAVATDFTDTVAATFTVQINTPSDTLSPTFITTDSTTPATGDGTSILALSPSNVTSGVSITIASPGDIITAITVTSA